MKGLLSKKLAGLGRISAFLWYLTSSSCFFDFLTSEGTDCLGTKPKRNYEKTGKFKSRGSKAPASANDADDPSAGDSGED